MKEAKFDEKEDAGKDELDPRAGERNRHALPAIVEQIAADGQTAKAPEDDVSARVEDVAHDHVAHLMKQDGDENAGDPDTEVEEAVLRTVHRPSPTEEDSHQPEQRMHTDINAEQPKGKVELGGFR